MEIQKTSIFAWKSTYPAIAAISSAVSQPISTKFGMVNLLESGGVVVEPKFKNTKYVAMEIWNADFEAPFVQERVRLCPRFHSK